MRIMIGRNAVFPFDFPTRQQAINDPAANTWSSVFPHNNHGQTSPRRGPSDSQGSIQLEGVRQRYYRDMGGCNVRRVLLHCLLLFFLIDNVLIRIGYVFLFFYVLVF
jgi:hypothetical protein